MIIMILGKIINYIEIFLRKMVIVYNTSSFTKQLNKIRMNNYNDKRVVFIDTDCMVGGSQKLTIQLGLSLKNSNYSAVYIATESYGSAKDWKKKIIKSFTDFIDIRMSINKESKLIKALKIIKPNYIIITNSKLGYKITPKIKRLYPNVIIYDIIHASINNYNKFIVTEEFVENIDLRIAACDGLKQNLIENYSEISRDSFKERVVVIKNGTKINPLQNNNIKSTLRKDLNIKKSEFVVLFIGSFAEHKDPMSILKISKKLSQDFDDIHFVLFGNGPLKRQLQYYIHKFGISRNTHMIVNSNSVYDILSESDVLILPSIVESLGLVILEAMSMGVPPIVSNVGYQNEIIDDEIDGFLIERNNNFIDKFIDKIISLKNNKQIYLKIKNNALIKVKNKYDVNNTLQNYHHYL